MKNVFSKDMQWKCILLGGKGMLIFCCQIYVKCLLKSQDISTQALTPELNAFPTSVFLNNYY